MDAIAERLMRDSVLDQGETVELYAAYVGQVSAAQECAVQHTELERTNDGNIYQ